MMILQKNHDVWTWGFPVNARRLREHEDFGNFSNKTWNLVTITNLNALHDWSTEDLIPKRGQTGYTLEGFPKGVGRSGLRNENTRAS